MNDDVQERFTAKAHRAPTAALPLGTLDSKKAPLRVVAGIIWRNDRNELLIAQRHFHDSLGGFWEFPGGKVEKGESYPLALRRELKEELGILVKIGRHVFTAQHEYPARLIRIRFYNAWIAFGTPKPLDAAAIRWVRPQDLYDYQFPPADRHLIDSLAKTMSPPQTPWA